MGRKKTEMTELTLKVHYALDPISTTYN